MIPERKIVVRDCEVKPPLRILSWNMAHRDDSWRKLVEYGYDVALVQEASEPPADVAARVHVDSQEWRLGGAGVGPRLWRSAVVGLSDRVDVQHLRSMPVDDADWNAIPVSRSGTLAAAHVTVRATGAKYLVASLYGAWESPRFSLQAKPWIFADASVHRLISDSSAVVATQDQHRIIAAGDLNLLRGYGENGSVYWRDRYATVFARMETLGIPFVGPELPEGSIPRAPVPRERPVDNRTVPTFRARNSDPTSATRQLDFVFASRGLLPSLRVTALESPDEWGPSDHCRVDIEVGGE